MTGRHPLTVGEGGAPSCDPPRGIGSRSSLDAALACGGADWAVLPVAGVLAGSGGSS